MSSTTFNPTTNNARLSFSRIRRRDELIDSLSRHPSWIIWCFYFADFCESLWDAFAAFFARLRYACARLWRASVDLIFHNFSISAFALFAVCNFDYVRAIGATFIFFIAYMSLTSGSPSSTARPLLPVAQSSDLQRDPFPFQPAIFTALAISLFFLLAFKIATGALLIFALLILSLRSRPPLSLIHGSRCCFVALIFAVCVYIFGVWLGIFIHNKFRLPPETARQLK